MLKHASRNKVQCWLKNAFSPDQHISFDLVIVVKIFLLVIKNCVLDFVHFEKSISFCLGIKCSHPTIPFLLNVPICLGLKTFFSPVLDTKWTIKLFLFIHIYFSAKLKEGLWIEFLKEQLQYKLLDNKVVSCQENKRNKRLFSLEKIFQPNSCFTDTLYAICKFVWIFLSDPSPKKQTLLKNVFCLMCPSITRQSNKILIMAHRGYKETLNPLNKWLQSNCLICSFIL